MNEREELYSKINADIIAKKPRKATCYDFGKTFSPDDMRTFTIISSYEIDEKKFWDSSNKLAKDNLIDNNLMPESF